MVRGHFADVTGTGTFAAKTGKPIGLEITIGGASVDTGVAKRDAPLRSNNCFEAATFPIMTFAAKEIKEGQDGAGRTVGNLTSKGVTGEVNLGL